MGRPWQSQRKWDYKNDVVSEATTNAKVWHRDKQWPRYHTVAHFITGLPESYIMVPLFYTSVWEKGVEWLDHYLG